MRRFSVSGKISILVVFLICSLFIINFKPIGIIYSNSSIKWTIITYLAGDNNLESYAFDALNQMESGKRNTDDITVIALIDQSEYYNESKAEWNETRIYEIQHDTSSSIKSSLLENMGERNLGSKDTLEYLLNFSFTNYPADNYMFIGFNHGSGVHGWSSDYADGEKSRDRLTMWEFRRAFEISNSLIGKRIDIISLLACNMAYFEVAYELRDVCDYFIAEQQTGWGAGISWEDLVRTFEKNLEITPIEVCNEFCTLFRSSFTNWKYKTTISAIKTDQLNDVFKKLNQFTSNLSSYITLDYFKNIIKAIENTFQTSYVGRDLMSFVRKIEEDQTLTMKFPRLNQAANDLLQSLDNAIIINSPHFTIKKDVTGLNIYLPFPYSKWCYFESYNNTSPSHNLNLLFSYNSTWVSFLNNFYFNDFDEDDLPDWFEIYYDLNPVFEDFNFNGEVDKFEDNDKDGFYSITELDYGSNPLVNDSDSDGLSDYDEIIQYNTKPFLIDSDFDTIPDGVELREGKDPSKNNDMLMDYYHRKYFLRAILTPTILVLSPILIGRFIIKQIRHKRNKNQKQVREDRVNDVDN